jgi:hypothetical protein
MMDDLRWTYSFDPYSQFKSTITNPDGGQLVHWFHPPGMWNANLVYRINAPNGSVRKRAWAQNKAWGVTDPLSKDPSNPYIAKETVTVGDRVGTPTKTTAIPGSAAVGRRIPARDFIGWCERRRCDRVHL